VALTPQVPQDIIDLIRDLQRRVSDLETAAPIRNAQISGGQGLTVNSTAGIKVTGGGGITVEAPGTVRSSDFVAGSTGWSLGAAAEFNTLTLRGGIIGNDALANPADFGSSGSSASGWTVPTVETSVLTGSITVPAGFTRAVVLAIASAGAVNQTASADFLYVAAAILGTRGGSSIGYAGPSGGWTMQTAHAIRALTGLSGGSITLDCKVDAAGGWGSNTSNVANLDAIAVFRR